LVSITAKLNRYKNREPQLRRRFKQTVMSIARLCLGAGLLAGLSLLLVFGHDALLQCHYFDAQRLSVAGNKRLSRQEVLDQAGLKPGVRTLSINLSLVRNRLLAHPWIADAELHRELPGTIDIRVREEQSVALIAIDRSWLVNPDGVIFKEATPAETLGLVVVEGLDYLDIPASGSGPSAAFRAVMEILALERRPEAPISLALIDRITVDREVGLTLTAFGGQKTIRMGYGDYAGKCARLKRLIDYLKQEGRFDEFAAIDLNSPERAVAAPASSPPPKAQEKEV
jgi:cell division protein FtsQ